MKKLLTGLLAATTLITPMSAMANNEQIVEGTPENNSGDIRVEINLGFDPTSDNEQEPPHPDMWIRVAIPTEVILFTDPDASHETFMPVSHTIRNHSVRGVQIDVSAFEAGTDTDESAFAPINLLNIASGTTTLAVIQNGRLTGITGQQLMTLAGNGNQTPNPTDEYVEGAFTFNGIVDTELLTPNAQEVLQTNLTLHLRPLDQDGNLYATTN